MLLHVVTCYNDAPEEDNLITQNAGRFYRQRATVLLSIPEVGIYGKLPQLLPLYSASIVGLEYLLTATWLATPS
jgi:hypothetical protein